MSQRQAKRRRRLQPQPHDYSNDQITLANVGPYLKDILRKFPGWGFISISKPGCMADPSDEKTKHVVPVQVHKMLPAMDDSGLYDSGDNRLVRYVEVADDSFQGMVMDRHLKCCIGDPFHVELDDPKMEDALNRAFQPKQQVIDLSDAEVQQL